MLALARALTIPDFGTPVRAVLTVVYLNGQERTLSSPIAVAVVPVAPAAPVATASCVPVAPRFIPSADFRTASHAGEPYRFTKGQAAVVKALSEAKEAGLPGLSKEEIQRRAGTTGDRLRDLFQRTPDGRRAWGKLILPNGDGTFRLAD
jgi:hypothetical protein